MEGKQLFIFDLDGTLADVYTAVEKSINYTRKQFGQKPVGSTTVRRSIGHGDANFVSRFFPKKQLKEALSIYRKHHLKAVAKYSKPLPYAKKVLAALKRKGKFVAIASNRPQAFTERVVDKIGIRKYLDRILCADTIKSLKPKPKILNVLVKFFKVKKAQAVYIGDMAVDVETANRAKVDSVFIKGGSSSLSQVRHFKNKRTISSLQEVLKFYV